MTRRSPLMLLALTALASECDTVQTGPSKYSDELLEMTLDPGRMCTDPAGALLSVTATYRVTCVDEDLCGRDLGESYDVTYVIDGGPQETLELGNGDVAEFDESCTQFTAEVQAWDEDEQQFRQVGGVGPDCIVNISGPAAAGTSRFKVILDPVGSEAIEFTCDDHAPITFPQPTTVEVRGTGICEHGATLDLGGVAEGICGTSTTCTPGDLVTYPFDIEPFGELGVWPEATGSDGSTWHAPYHCHDVNVSLRGTVNGNERTMSASLDQCVLSFDESEVDAATDVSLQLEMPGYDPAVTASVDCP